MCTDDIQLYIKLRIKSNLSDNIVLIYCFNVVKKWFLQYSVMMNMNKTQLLNISRTSSVLTYVIIYSVRIVPIIMLKTLVLFSMIA